MTNKLLAILPCAGFGTRVSAYVPSGMYKEMGCVGDSDPNILIHLNALLSLDHVAVDILSVILPKSKESLKQLIKDTITKLGFSNELYRQYFNSSTGGAYHTSETFIRNTDGVEQRVILDYVSDDLHKTQNPLDAIVYARSSTAEIVIADNSKWDAMFMFPDVHYTNMDTVIDALKNHRKHNSGEYGMASLCVKSVPELDPMKFGRHYRFNSFDLGLGDEYVVEDNNPQIYGIEFSTSNETAHPRPTHLETGILYLPYRTLFKKYPQGTWVYDMMINQDAPIHAIDITGTKLVDLGDPMSYINNAKGQHISWKYE